MQFSTKPLYPSIVFRIDPWGMPSVEIEGQRVGLISEIEFRYGQLDAVPRLRIKMLNKNALENAPESLTKRYEEYVKILKTIPYCKLEYVDTIPGMPQVHE